MKSRTSFFNKTLFRKNLTRFAPVWACYLLCLMLGLMVMYMDQNTRQVNFWFASHMAQCIQVMGVVNLFYGPLAAMLLFGDLFNPRMCNALHAMPVRRETFFVTNVLAGLFCSLVPTAIMALLSIPLLMATVVHNAWLIALLWFVAANLQFLFFFGMAVFSVFCTGNRLFMAAVYAGLNAGAYLVYYLINTIYTPMLYGVITPTALLTALTPISGMIDSTFVEVENYNDLMNLFRGREQETVAKFWVNECYYDLIVWALVGLLFLAVGLVLYRKRDLECAGDAVAFPILAPVVQVACSICVCAGAGVVLNMFFGYSYRNYPPILYTVLACGLAVGWFGAKMFLEHSTRVFRPKNWIGLGAMVAVVAVSLALTWLDVFGIETWMPKADKVSKVVLNGVQSGIELTDREDIEKIIRLQELALEDRIEDSGRYPVRYLEANFDSYSNVSMPDEGFRYGEEGDYDDYEPHMNADRIYLIYTLESGKEVRRQYNIWTSLEEGEIVKEFANRWDALWKDACRYWDIGTEEFQLDQVFRIEFYTVELEDEEIQPGMVDSLIAAMKADAAEGNMTQDSFYHQGLFAEWDEEYQTHWYSNSYSVRLVSGEEPNVKTVHLGIYADAAHTVRWLQENGFMEELELDMTKSSW